MPLVGKSGNCRSDRCRLILRLASSEVVEDIVEEDFPPWEYWVEASGISLLGYDELGLSITFRIEGDRREYRRMKDI